MPILMPVFTEVYRYYQRLKSVIIGSVEAGFELTFDFPNTRLPFEIDFPDTRQTYEISFPDTRQPYEFDMSELTEA